MNTARYVKTVVLGKRYKRGKAAPQEDYLSDLLGMSKDKVTTTFEACKRQT